MKLEYPKMIYSDKTYTVVKSEDEYNLVKDIYNKPACPGGDFIPFSVAVDALQDAKKEVLEKDVVVEKEEEKKETPPDDKDYINKMSWNELRAYGKKIEREYGVEIPLRATREVVEETIKGILNGNDKRLNQASI